MTEPTEPTVPIQSFGVEKIVEYAAFNDATIFEPRFASGELPAAMRFVIDEPLAEGTLWTVARFARLQNEERAQHGLMDSSGPVVVSRRTVTRTAWEPVPFAELDEALST